MFEGFCPSFANQYIGFNLPISLLCVDVNLGIFLPLPPQHSRLWKKEGVSLPLWWLCISNISLFGQLFSYSKDPQVFVIDLIRSFKQTANIILECFFFNNCLYCAAFVPSTNLENPFRLPFHVVDSQFQCLFLILTPGNFSQTPNYIYQFTFLFSQWHFS